MDSDSITMTIVLVLLIMMSAYFSASETAFSSLNRARLKSMANNGNKRAVHALALVENYDRLLSTLLIGNNIVNITAASIATVLFVKEFGENGVTIATIVMTISILIFGEISPKSLAKEAPESFALFSTPLMRFFIVLLMPLNFLFLLWKKLLSKLFKPNDDRSITEEELITIVDEAQNEGGIDENEGELIRSAIEFNDLDVGDILTPRVDIIAIEENSSMEDIAAIFRKEGFSRLPVYRGSIDNIIGVLHEKDFYTQIYMGSNNISAIIKNAVYATMGMKISHLLRMLQISKTHIAVVVDEFGGTAGIVTLEDILEELVGEIWDEHDEVKEYYKEQEDGSWLVSCNADLDEMFDRFGIQKEYDDATTVGGWVIEEMGRIPDVGEGFTFESLTVTVTKTSAKRVLEIHVQQTSPTVEEA
ncbi:MAG: HlyC/CorC family transporter [Christensenellales bacterium]